MESLSYEGKGGWRNTENVGMKWNPDLGASVSKILNYDQYNGRVNLLDDSDPNARFQMAERIGIKNKASEYRDALTGMQETSVLATHYFSAANVQILQNGLRAGVYEMSGEKLVVPPQNIDNLKIIMRSMYLQYAKHSASESIRNQIQRLNKYVLDYAVASVYNEAQGYLNYMKAQSTLVMPMDRPTQVDRDYKHLEWKGV